MIWNKDETHSQNIVTRSWFLNFSQPKLAVYSYKETKHIKQLLENSNNKRKNHCMNELPKGDTNETHSKTVGTRYWFHNFSHHWFGVYSLKKQKT